ncbi:unnamed protein product [Peronospora effusa]|nr:unnamed protein product [Peronospora effusa]
MMARCYAKLAAGAKEAIKKPPNPKDGSKNRARRMGSDSSPDNSGNAGAQSKVVVTRTRSTRRIKTIKGTSKQVTYESVSVKENGPTNELFEAVEDKMPEASSFEMLQLVLASVEEIVNLSEMTRYLFLSELKEGKIDEIVAPVPEENVEDCCSSSTMDESVLETDKKKRFAAQGWDALTDSPFYDVLWKHRDVFPAEVPSRLPADKGIRHEIDLEPGTWHQVFCSGRCRKNKSITSMSYSTSEPRRDMYMRASRLTSSRPSVCVKQRVDGAWFMLIIR